MRRLEDVRRRPVKLCNAIARISCTKVQEVVSPIPSGTWRTHPWRNSRTSSQENQRVTPFPNSHLYSSLSAHGRSRKSVLYCGPHLKWKPVFTLLFCPVKKRPLSRIAILSWKPPRTPPRLPLNVNLNVRVSQSRQREYTPRGKTARRHFSAKNVQRLEEATNAWNWKIISVVLYAFQRERTRFKIVRKKRDPPLVYRTRRRGDERSFDSEFGENCHGEDSRAFSLAALVNFRLLSLIIITAENRDHFVTSALTEKFVLALSNKGSK